MFKTELPPIPERGPGMAPLSLLCVDDDALFLDFIALTAARVFPGARIDTLLDSMEVDGVCAATTYDCVVLDYRMPGLDGLACAKSLHAAYPYLPIILVTGAGDGEVATSALHNGVTDYVPKSRLSAQSLRRTIDNAIRLAAQKRTIDHQRVELETFTFALAHDFKQPLRQIVTFTRMLSAELGDGLPADAASHMTFLNTAARRLSKLVDAMSSYALLSQPAAMTPIDLGEVATEVCASLSSYIEDRKGRVVVTSAQTVYANRTLMTQVLLNLIVNGLKYNSSATPTVSIRTTTTKDHCRISVRDNGIGIDQQYQDQIFSPLVRLHSEAEYSGTGLGLTIVRRAMAAQNGAVTCRSGPGCGSEFLLKVPLAALH
ncbi:MAG: hypothetical protein JWP35_4426 [Caulobacter sp.]|nr:hypothetical protein [Caulobacter sp.]